MFTHCYDNPIHVRFEMTAQGTARNWYEAFDKLVRMYSDDGAGTDELYVPEGYETYRLTGPTYHEGYVWQVPFRREDVFSATEGLPVMLWRVGFEEAGYGYIYQVDGKSDFFYAREEGFSLEGENGHWNYQRMFSLL